ncbi:hypothetical protein [Streptomyces sp. NBC_01565]|uniref:hypothetical protein n=1 Tax=Streptomyces sp. NBC_01565 TaxID=2975881 RepID=UPI0022556B6A|nr:hypothetical protein [Streptomyces sp. NBC_01565]MCX4540452.1 hypothetical protein [Streptomyces sp. NBC_01565]
MSHGAHTEAEDDSSSSTDIAVPQVIISELVPEGRAVIPVQAAGRTYIAVHPEAEVKQLVHELNGYIQHAYAVGHVVPWGPSAETRERPTNE